MLYEFRVVFGHTSEVSEYREYEVIAPSLDEAIQLARIQIGFDATPTKVEYLSVVEGEFTESDLRGEIQSAIEDVLHRLVMKIKPVEYRVEDAENQFAMGYEAEFEFLPQGEKGDE